MATVRDLKRKLASLGNMQRVTNAMNMIASTRLQALLRRWEGAIRFEEALERVAAAVTQFSCGQVHVLTQVPETVTTVHTFVFSADKGLCGPFNSMVGRELNLLAGRLASRGRALEVTCLGNRIRRFCRIRGMTIVQAEASGPLIRDPAPLKGMAQRIVARIQSGEIQRIRIIYNRYVSTLTQKTENRIILPLASAAETDANVRQAELTADTEPVFNDFIVPAAEQLVYYHLRNALMHSAVGEFAARMTAMENATRNARSMIDRYKVLRNRARQAGITAEILEIIAGKETLDQDNRNTGSDS